MKLSDKLQVEINQARARLLELAEIEEPTDENRNELEELRSKVDTLTTRHETAIEAEAIEQRAIEEDPTSEDAEGREISALIRDAQIGPFIREATERDTFVIDGRESELRSALEIRDGDFPMCLLMDWSGAEEEVRAAMHLDEEYRADTVTAPPAALSTQVQSGSWLARLMVTTNARFIGVTTRSVGPGEHVYPYVDGTAAASTPTKGTAVDAVAGVINHKRHQPRAVQSRYLISEEDQMRLGQGYEAALRRDLREQIAEGLDKFVFADGTDGMLETIPAPSDDADLAAGASNLTHLHTGIVGAIDGRYAGELSDLNVSVTPGLFQRMSILAPTNTSAFLTDYLRAHGCGVRANAHIPASLGSGSKVGESYVLVSRARGIVGSAIMSVYAGARMGVDTSGVLMQKRQVALNVVGYFDFDVIRTANWTKFRAATA
ncbi:MAG: hypothetical protein OXU36_10545 [Candidatus Poribacteria bacterium]|nr:hypothetical protein [Candidatus Poribacteria bacterium]